ncbi:ABC transporter substrate-binding protein [Asanoa iriomotensis]|uniref:Extracellular solute-binding protein n=1 Tax=Asanoa iriomotensis TaxID=234613 RepID=A0ABQ4BZ56_9ACTN|nr:ABC transporter substrate-binding protein [Asanoa iriomotensis]GIF55817.1 hypothetical protein Air01nite_19120 [Asanoa iriomotensis]
MGTQKPQTRGIDSQGLITRRTVLRASILGAGAITAAPLLAACGSDSGNDTGNSPRTAPSLVKPSGTVTLTLWTWAWPEEPLATELKNAFEQAVPEVKLEVKKFPFPDYETGLRTAVPNGTSGDVLHLQTGSMIRQYTQFLSPLEDLAKQAYGADWETQFLDGSVKEIRDSVAKGDPLVAMPQQSSIGGVLWVNRAVLAKAGGTVPTSHEHFVEISKELRSQNLVAATWGAKDNWPNTDYLVQFASQFKPGIIAAAEAGEASFTDDAVVAGLNYLKRTLTDQLWNAAPFATPAFPDAYDLFFNGKAATAAIGTWGTAALFATPNRLTDWAACLWPKLPDAPQDDWMGQSVSGIPQASSPSAVRPWRTVNVATAMRGDLTPDKQWAAWKFIEWSCGEAGQKAGSATYTPARKGIRPDGLNAEWQKIYDWHNELGKGAERREFAFIETRKAIESAIAAVCVNNADPKAELQRVDAAAKRARA